MGAVLMGEFAQIKEGDEVKRTRRIMSVPVGEAMVGRVVNALGQPIDGKGPIATKEFGAIERIAPGVVERQPVREPLETGIKAIDRMVNIGRGQRELRHRRPPDRQDRASPSTRSSTRRARASSASTSPSARSARRWPRW